MTLLKIHAPFALIGIAIALLVHWKYQTDLETARANYTADAHRATVNVAATFERALNELHDGMLTAARMPMLYDVGQGCDPRAMREMKDLFEHFTGSLVGAELVIALRGAPGVDDRTAAHLAWMEQRAPRSTPSRPVPLRGGPEPGDQAIVYSVPFYEPDGRLGGCLSAVVPVDALRRLMPAGHYMVVNRERGYALAPSTSGRWQLAREFAMRGIRDPGSIYSETIALHVPAGVGQWTFWASQPDELFWTRPDVRAARFAALVGAASACLLAVALWTIASLVGRTGRVLEGEKRRLEARVRRVVDSALDAIVETDADGLVTTWNPRAEAIFGWARDEATGRALATLILSDDDRDRLQAAMTQHIATGDSTMMNERVRLNARHRDGDVVPVEVVIVPVREERDCRFGVFMTDLADRVAAENERARLQRELVDASREAGKAEVASTVLHNVGNVLNSVNTSAHEIARHAGGLRAAEMIKVANLVDAHADDLSAFLEGDGRGRHLPRFLSQFGAHLEREQQTIVDEATELAARIDHIKQIVRMQQTAARTTMCREDIDLATLASDALALSSVSLDRHGVQVHREFEATPPVETDRHQVLQILVNLLGNAKNAMSQQPIDDRHLSVCIRPAGTTHVTVSVIDNGVGISPDNLRRLFRHGFTTREDGHGFGLHSASLAARQLGGMLTAASKGPGHGATFTLELPIAAPASLAA